NWDEVLNEFIPRMSIEPDFKTYTHDVADLLTRINDTHGYLGWMRDTEVNGAYIRPFTLKYVDKDWVVTTSKDPAIQPGDIIDAPEGKPPKDLAKKKSTEPPASTPASLMNKLSLSMIRSHQAETKVAIKRKGTLTVQNTKPDIPAAADWNPAWFPYP